MDVPCDKLSPQSELALRLKHAQDRAANKACSTYWNKSLRGKRMRENIDSDPLETGEWIDSLRAVLHHQGRDRASFLLERLTEEAQRANVSTPFALKTPYVNTIPVGREESPNWDREIEHRIRSVIR